MMALDWTPLTPMPSGYVCNWPVQFEVGGDAFMRSCGKCKRCMARKMRDVTGRCAAEASTSAEVCVFTLTYGDRQEGARDFVTKDRQLFLKQVRNHFRQEAKDRLRGVLPVCQNDRPRLNWRGNPMPVYASAHVRAYRNHLISQEQTTVRFFGCGERGEKRGRCHWHIVLFLSRASGFPKSERKRNGRLRYFERGEHAVLDKVWARGHVTVDILPAETSARVPAIFYCSKYLQKSLVGRSKRDRRRGVQREAVTFRSLGRYLGADYLENWARQVADAGLPLHQTYKVGGLTFSRGGALVENQLQGTARQKVIAEYRRRWSQLRPDKDVPVSDFLLRFDADVVQPRINRARRKPLTVKRSAERLPPVPDSRRNCSGLLMVDVYGRGNVGCLKLERNGEASFWHRHGDKVPVPGADLVGVVNLDETGHQRVAEWIAQKRGPDWLPPDQLHQLRERYRVKRLEALAAWAKRGAKVVAAHVQGLEPVTGMYRQLRKSGLVDADGRVIARPARGDDDALLAVNPPVTVPMRPHGEAGIFWKDMSPWLRKVP